jgi:uncharacterized membrane protein YkoI
MPPAGNAAARRPTNTSEKETRIMQNRINRSIMAFLLAVSVTALAAACASTKAGKEKKEDASERVSLAQLPAPARAAVEKLTAGGKIDKIDKEVEKGQIVYDIEATVSGKHVEYTIATDGAVVGTETSIEYSELPDAVRTAAEMYFGSATGLNPAKAVEDGQTTYEIEGTKNGKKVAVTFDPAGKLVGEEK